MTLRNGVTSVGPRIVSRRDRAAALGILSAAAAVGFSGVAAASATRAAAKVDRKAGPRLSLGKHHPVRRAAVFVAPLGKWYVYVPAGLAAALSLILESRGADARRRDNLVAGAIAIGASSIGAALVSKGFDRWLPQPPVPPGRTNRNKPVFPSGHTFGPTATALTAAYVLAREGMVDPRRAMAAALTPLLTATGKVVGQKHWASDVTGGYLAAVALSAMCLAAYEQQRRSDVTD